MARPLRIELKDGWYHVINRGLKRRRVGPLFQGRFKAILVAPDGSHLQVSR